MSNKNIGFSIKKIDEELSIRFRGIIAFIGEYHRYLDLVRLGNKWIDNGLRMIDIEEMDYKEKGLVLENSLGGVLDKLGIDYSLQVLMGEYQIADAVSRIGNILIRIEAKYVSKEYTRGNWKYKNLLEWSTKYRSKPDFFYPFTLLYINYDFYKALDKDDFRLAYANKLLITTFRTFPKILEEIGKIC
jgi:hypothetical protein